MALTVSPLPSEPTALDLTPVVGANLRRLRVKRGLSLERLAKVSGVSRAMLGQIELGQSTPTINVVWKVARALNVSFSALINDGKPPTQTVVMPADRAKMLTSRDGSFVSRALFPFDRAEKVEFYELRLKAHGVEQADAHAPGTTENLVLAEGLVEIRVDTERFQLARGDAFYFEADVAHEYRNLGSDEAVMYLVMRYA